MQRPSPHAGEGAAACWARRLAAATAAATLVLIVAGGVVTNTGSGLAVPDWPTTFGHNMFLYPLSGMVGGVGIEHSHRLIGSVVGLLTLALAATLWVAHPRGRLRWLGLVAVAGVIVQGTLGGLRVVLVKSELAAVHGMAAQAFFALVVGIALASAKPAGIARPGAPTDRAAARFAAVATVLVYLQSVLGALVTHAGRQIPAHVALGFGVAGLGLWLTIRVLGRHGDDPSLARPARLLAALLIVQLFLGMGSFLAKFSALGRAMGPGFWLALPVVHRLVASLLLAAVLALALRAAWRGGPEGSATTQGARGRLEPSAPRQVAV